MFILKIIKNGKQEQSDFNTLVEAQEHFEKYKDLGYWGKEEIPEVLNEKGEIISSLIPCEYSMEIIDISAQVDQDKINAESLKFLSDTDWKVLRHYREVSLGVPMSMTEAEYLILENDRYQAATRIVR